MNALTFNTGEANTEELKLVARKLEEIVCEIMDNEENEDNWMALKSCREALNSLNKPYDCKFTLYANIHAAQVWTNQAYAEANEDRSID